MTSNAYNFTYGYDEMGNRVTKSGNGVNEFYLRDQTGKELAVYTTGTNTIKMINLYGIGMIGKVDASGNNYYYIKDHLGSIRSVVNSSGTPVSAQDYYAYGGILNQSVSGDDRYKFTGKQRDDETNYDYFGARYYNSDVGIWHSLDPMRDSHPGESPYVYCNNNPLSVVDADGREGHMEALDPSHPDRLSWVLDEVDTYANPTNNDNLNTAQLAALTVAFTIDPDPISKILLGDVLVTYAAVKIINYVQEQTKPDATATYTINPSTDQLPTFNLNEEQTNKEEDRNSAQDQKLNPREVKKLKDNNYDPEALKDNNAGKDIYKDKKGNLYVKTKGDKGPGEPLNINIKKLPW
jgi:RHS repeat-associated protein